MSVKQVTIARMNSMSRKLYETQKYQISKTNTSRNNMSHIDHDATFSFKVKHDSHTNGDSWNEFRDLKTLRNNNKVIAVRQIEAEITKVT